MWSPFYVPKIPKKAKWRPERHPRDTQRIPNKSMSKATICHPPPLVPKGTFYVPHKGGLFLLTMACPDIKPSLLLITFKKKG